ncbi:glutathione S-transferase family protein [Starkeya sp. ORNL1]|uniref:glutathione S-transferase family protein n=1 Tax=Starkeya sp. ORNL1 TaxID=2709380 RepID=UPI001462A9C7|nr:glutathione S-transferase family protein [Starkeya sp. ORNL1]QJP15233.1 glutathione S-transferase family protein [Starkeya sp. ORNL1]
MITLYEQATSGNCYKVRLVLTHTGRPFRRVEVSARDGSTRSAEFLQRNPIGKVPTVELDDGRPLGESNAIMLHFAEGSPLLPSDAYDRAKVYEWLFFEQYSHEPMIAVRRALFLYEERRHLATPERLAQLLEGGDKALNVMEGRLAAAHWLAGNAFSIADIALYAYTHTAEEGGYDLSAFPAVQAWLGRVARVPGHVPLEA